MPVRTTLIPAFLTCLFCPFSPTPAFAGVLSIQGAAVNWIDGPSPTLTLLVKNDSLDDVPLLAYQLDIFIAAGPGATGPLRINSVSMADPGYAFEGGSLFTPSFPGPPADSVEDFSDFDLLGGRTMIPGESLALVTLDFDDSLLPSHEGLFYIQLGGFDTDFGSFYVDANEGVSTSFLNVPSGPRITVASIQLGAVQDLIAVPEPGSLQAFGNIVRTSGFLGWLLLAGRRRRK